MATFFTGFTVTKQEFPYIRFWLICAVTALALAGLFSLLLVTARTPGLQTLFTVKEFFRVSLIVHVNLSVLVWMLSSCALVLELTRIRPRIELLFTTQAALMLLGMLLLCIAPFVGEAVPYLNNYVPMLESEPFQLGLGLIGVSACIGSIERLIHTLHAPRNILISATHLLGFAIALILCIAGFSFVQSWLVLQQPHYIDLFSNEDYYERLFWSAGHVLQFAYTLLLCACWLWLSIKAGIPPRIHARAFTALTTLMILAVLPSPFLHLIYPLDSYEFIHFFTGSMNVLLGILPVLIAMGIVRGFFVHMQKADALRSLAGYALLCSMILFGLGGIFGFLIEGVNVTIPAHYHGSIVGVTLAVIGVIYLLVPAIKLGALSERWARIQLSLYAGGQFLHALGLGLSGGYGVMRKHPEAYTQTEVQVYMGMMGLGGLLAVLGGIFFVAILARSLYMSQSIDKTRTVMEKRK